MKEKMRERSEENRGEDNEKIMKERERERMEECLLLFALTPGTGRCGSCKSRREKCEVGEEEKKKGERRRKRERERS